MGEERPIVFTIQRVVKHNYEMELEFISYNVFTKDHRADVWNDLTFYDYKDNLFDRMEQLCKHYNNKGYAVLFEVN